MTSAGLYKDGPGSGDRWIEHASKETWRQPFQGEDLRPGLLEQINDLLDKADKQNQWFVDGGTGRQDTLDLKAAVQDDQVTNP